MTGIVLCFHLSLKWEESRLPERKPAREGMFLESLLQCLHPIGSLLFSCSQTTFKIYFLYPSRETHVSSLNITCYLATLSFLIVTR